MALTLLPTAAMAEGPADPVAQIGNTTYATLKDAIDAVPSNGGTPTMITVLRNVTDAVGMTVPSGKNFIVDFGGYTYTVNKPGAGSKNTETQAFQLLKDSTIVFKNGTLRVAEDNLKASPIEGSSPVMYTNIRRLIQCYADLTLEDMTIDGTNQYGGASYVMSFNNQPVKLTGKTSVIAAEGKVAFDVDGNWGNPTKYDRCKVTINTTGTIVGNIEVGQGILNMQNANVKGGIVLCTSCGADETTGQKERITVTGGTFTGDVSAYLSDNYIQNNGKVEALGETNAVAKIGNTYYKSLVDAYAAMVKMCSSASEPIVITLLKDSEGGGMGSDKDPALNYVIDFNGHTYTVGAPAVGSTGTVSQGLRVLKGSTAKFMNGTLKAANYEKLRQVVHTYGDVTFEDFTVDATGDPYAWAAVEPDAGSLKILGNSSILAREGQYGLYAAFWHIDSYNGTTVDVDTTGKITGKLAYEFDEDYTDPNKATENKGFVNIKNGNFDILSIQEIWSDVSDAVDKNVGGIIISGGYFTSDPSAYLAAGKGLVTSDQNAFAYKVGDKTTNVETAVTAGEAAVTIPAGVAGITEANVKNAAKASNTTKTLTDTVAASGMTNDSAVVGTKEAAEAALTAKGISVNSGDTVTVVVQPYLEVNVKSADAGKLTLEISAKYNVVATTDDPTTIAPAKTATLKSGVPLSINKPIELTIVLPTGFATENSKIYVQHKGYEYTATVNASGATATFINPHGFSTFTVTPTASAVAEVDGTNYTDLQKAVDAVSNNGTVKLLNDTSASAVVSRAVKFTLDKNSKSFAGAITAGSGYKLSVDGDVYTFTVRSSSGSSGGSSSSSRRYDVSAPSVKHGDVTVSPKSASKGDTVTITVKPDSGYELDTLTVKDASGSKIKVKDKGDGKFTFTMPASKVTVSAEFAEIETLDFADVSTDAYYYEAVKWAAKKGITGGTGDGTFNPNGSCTRAHIVTFLWRAAGSPEPKSTVSFADVPADSYYAKAVAWAVENGITLGTGDGTFSPNATCTRAQSVTFLYRALGTAPTTVNGFTDVTADAFYADAVAWAVESGVTNGTSASTFSPNNGCTRAQIVTFLYRTVK